jgi:hypothetical protein
MLVNCIYTEVNIEASQNLSYLSTGSDFGFPKITIPSGIFKNINKILEKSDDNHDGFNRLVADSYDVNSSYTWD